MGRASLKAVRKKEILTGFYAVAKKVGLENASIGKVADHLDINPSLVVHYFSTREALLEELIHFILEQYNTLYQAKHPDYTNERELKTLIDNLFSRKWNKLFDDSVFYSCYALTYRNTKLQAAFLELHNSLRTMLTRALKKASKNGVISVANEQQTADVIFALMEGGYYYLGMFNSEKDSQRNMNVLKKQAYQLLGLV